MIRWYEAEPWKPDDETDALMGARIIGRATILRAAEGEAERVEVGERGIAVAHGLLLRLRNGRTAAVWYNRVADAGVFLLAPKPA